MTWLYSHINYLPKSINSNAVCQWTENLDHFPMDNVVSLNRQRKPVTFSERLARRAGLWAEEKIPIPLLERVIRSSAPAVLHSHFGQCGWAAAKIAHKHNLPHIVSFYGLDLSYLPRVDARWVTRYRRMSKLVNLVLCEGPHMAGVLASLGVEPDKIRVFRLGVDLTKIPFIPRTNKRVGPKRFLIAGSFREKKGIPYALTALGLLPKSCGPIEITVIGDSSGSERDEREKRKIIGVVEQYGLGDRTRFLGYQPYDVFVRELYQHDAFISPSITASDGDTEGGAPVTIIEAAASGMPIISTEHCDIPFVLSLENGKYLAAERDASQLAKAAARLMECEDWQPMTSANRRLAEDELDVRRQAAKLAGIYRGLSGSSCPSQQK